MNQARSSLLSRLTKAIALVAMVTALGATALAQDDPPGRVARLNLVSGSVTFRPDGVDDWAPADVNLTVSTGDRVWTDVDSRAEFHAGSTAFRMSSQTDLSIVNLNDETTQLSVAQGILNIRVSHLDPSSVFEVDTPNSAILILREGSYRINVNPDGGESTVVVRRGECDVTAEGSSFNLKKHQVALIDGVDNVSYDVRTYGEPDDWDNWCDERDAREARVADQHYVSDEMTGYEDLAGYGSWHTDGGYGSYWVPTGVAVGWAPYSYGHWAWTGPWGWAWVDSSPWGFAPFHYGRWAYVGGAWGWVPGAYVAAPVYAPALVGFVGGAGFVIGGGVGVGVGWFPLGPHEVFVPGYAVSAVYVRQVNITHVNVTNINVVNVNRVTYVNRGVVGAVSCVSQRDFASGHVVVGGGVRVSGGVLASAQVTGCHPTVVPTRQAVLGGYAGGRGKMPPAGSLNRRFVAKSTPPPARPTFASQQKLLQTSGGKPLDHQSLAGLSRQSGGGGQQQPKFKSAATSTSGGLHASRSGLPALQPASAAGSTAGAGKGSGAGKGAGAGSGTGTAKGAGAGSSAGTGKGSGAGSSAGTGKGAGAGSSAGTGKGTGTGSSSGTGKGAGAGSSSGTGKGTGAGSTSGTGKGASSTSGAGKGTGSGGGTSGNPAKDHKSDQKAGSSATGSHSGSSSSSSSSSSAKGTGTGPSSGGGHGTSGHGTPPPPGGGTGSHSGGTKGGGEPKSDAKPKPTPDKKKG